MVPDQTAPLGVVWSGFIMFASVAKVLRSVSEYMQQKYASFICIINFLLFSLFEPWHEISNNVESATSKASDQPAHLCKLIGAFASPLNILWLLSFWLNIIWSF